jgi:hypothetical protein
MSFVTATVLILWYFCLIGGELSEQTGIIKFIYFRSSRCHMPFSWEYVNVTGESVEVITSDHSSSSKKTLVILVLYVLINLALIVTAIMAFCEFVFVFISCI